MTGQANHRGLVQRFSPCAAAILVAGSAGMALGQGIVTETFDTALNGWSTYADAGNLAWVETGGNPGGAARAQDEGSGGWWGFLAGPAFLGDRSCTYGGTLAWHSKTNGVNTAGNSQPDVAIEGAGLVLVFDLPNPVVNVWAIRSVTLTETAGWKKTSLSGVPPTLAEFQSVLANVTALKFRGEFTSASGGDIGFLDNVAMGSFTLVSPESTVACTEQPVSLSVIATGPNPLTFQWQWRPTSADAWIDIAEGLNTDPLGGPIQFVAQAVNSSTVTFSDFGDTSEQSHSWENRCLVADTCSASSIPATITVCPSDFNCDAAFDFFDYLDFVSSFVANDPEADFNADGVVDFFDYPDFVQIFGEGC